MEQNFIKNGKNGNRKGKYVGAWIPLSLHTKLKAVSRKERTSIHQMLKAAVRRIVREGKVEA